MNQIKDLITKYDKPVPRYTSYPAMPHWQTEQFSVAGWKEQVVSGFHAAGEEGISLYIHLPYCESLCTYCGCNTRITVNHKVELPYIEALFKEWQLYTDLLGRKPLIREIHLGGGTPTFFAPENLQYLVKSLLNQAEVHPDHCFSFEGHPRNTTYEHLKALSEVGFTRVSYGVQDFDLKVQRAINRIQTYEQVEQVTRWSRELGYDSVNFDLIYGLPFQSLDSVRDTMEQVATLMPDRIAFYSYAHVPWFKPGQRAYSEADLPKGDEKRQLNEAGRQELLSLGYADIGMDHFALPTDSLFMSMKLGKLHRNFMGYTEQNSRLLIGLGASAISDSSLGYAQNAKVVEQYMEQVNAGAFPVFKGHSMSRQQQETRELVLDIICNRWITFEQVDGLPEERYAVFQEMLEEGLLTRKWNDYRVSALGTQFLRNICAIFDPNFEAEGKKKVFSQSV